MNEWPYYKALEIILCTTRNVLLPNLFIPFGEIFLDSLHQLRQLSVLTAHSGPEHIGYFCLTSIQTSEALIKELLSLRTVMAKGETSGNLLLLSGYEAWRSCFVKSRVTLKDVLMKRPKLYPVLIYKRFFFKWGSGVDRTQGAGLVGLFSSV